ncbi:GTPase IMAP family member 9-like [Haliotis rubra]|uniref:GTPase IMAP family member 9-like n=1 Tax=Haliotis rubra TaxID=36100 RepID=UPI001EE5CDF2|nr:GTPase IMAP family member 9-like [Haliotis rubra]
MVSATAHKLEAIEDKLKAIPTPIWRIYERDEVPTETVRVVLLGYAKTGKNLLANTIAGEKLFEAGLLKPTTVCQEKRASVDNMTFQIMDTPGFSLHNRQNIQTTVEELVSRASSTDAFLLVVKASPITYEEDLLFKHASAIARKTISHKIVVVFTTLDDDITLKGYLKNIPSFLKEFLQFCQMANDQIQDLLRATAKIQSTHVQEQQMRRIPHKLTAAIRELEKRYRDNLTRQIQQMQIIL